MQRWGRCQAGSWDVHCAHGNFDRVVPVERVQNVITGEWLWLCAYDAEGFRLLNQQVRHLSPLRPRPCLGWEGKGFAAYCVLGDHVGPHRLDLRPGA